jgi:serine/threonine protein kinase
LDTAIIYLKKFRDNLFEFGFNFLNFISRNIFIDYANDIKLGDFGISKFVESGIVSDERHTFNIGTTEYMAPELFSRDSLINELIDIW